MTKKTLSIILIFVAGLVLRFYLLGQVPNGLTTDEADVGYNAYSLIKTHKDVYGRTFPLFLQSFNDYKPGLGTYLQIPAVYFIGPSDFSIRLLPAITGSVVPLLLFFFLKLSHPKNTILPFTALVLTTLSPWEIALSRMENVIVSVFLFLLFLIFFSLSITKNPKYIIACALVLAISFYEYYASIIYSPLIALFLISLYFKFFLKSIKIVIVSIGIFLLIASPAIVNYFSEQGRSRVSAINVFTADVTLPVSLKEMEYDKESSNKLFTIFHNRRFVYINTYLDNYFDFFNMDYLFVNSAKIRYFYVNYVGLLYAVELPFFFYGIWCLMRRRSKNDLLILALLLMGPIPGAFVLGAAYPHRALIFILAIQIISALGVAEFFQKCKSLKARIFKISIIGLYLISVVFFLHQYFVHSPQEFNNESNNGAWLSTEVKTAIPVLRQHQNNYEKIVFTWSVAKLAPAVYFMFYEKLDPTQFQTKAVLWTKDPPSFRQIYNQIGKIEFRTIDWKHDKDLKNTLLVGYPEDFPKYNEGIVAKTYESNGKIHFVFVDPSKVKQRL